MVDPTLAITLDTAGDLSWTTDATGDVLGNRGVVFSRGVYARGIATLLPPRSGPCNFTLNNSGGSYDADGTLTRGDACRITATYSGTTYPLWRGKVKRLDHNPGTAFQQVTVDAEGSLSQIVGRNGFSSALFKAITVDTAIGHVLDAAGFPRNIADYCVTDLSADGYYGLGEASGDAIDTGSGGVDGTVTIGSGVRDAAALDDLGDGSIEFDGASTRILATRSVSFSGGRVIGCIFDADSDGEGSVGKLIGGQGFSLITQDESGGNVRLRFEHTFSGDDGRWDTAVNVSLNATHVVSVDYDSSDTANNPTIYVDGVALTVGSGLTESGTPTGTADGTTTLFIGNNLAGSATFDGHIDEVFLIPSSLTAAQHRGIYDRAIDAPRDLDTSSLTLNHWWLDLKEDPFQAIADLVRTEGPDALFYEKTNGAVKFENAAARTTNNRSTSIQSTVRGTTTEPITHRILRYDDGVDRVANSVTLERRVREGGNPTPTFEGYSEANATSGATSIAVAHPTSQRADDLLIAFLSVDPDANDVSAGFSTPSGWTVGPTPGNGGPASGDTGPNGITYYQRIGDSPATSTTFSWTQGGDVHAAIGVFRGVVTSGSPFDDTSTDSNNENDASPAHTAITTTGTNRLIVAFAATRDGTFAAPAGMDPIISGGGNNPHAIVAAAEQVAAGSSSAFEWTGGSGDEDTALGLMALTPAQSIVWSHGEQITLTSSEVKKLVATSSDPFENATTPVEDTDFTVSSGSVTVTVDRASGSSITITLTDGGTGSTIDGPPGDLTKGIQLRADPVKVSARSSVTSEDTTSQTSYGLRGLPSYSIRHEIAATDMQTLADNLITSHKDPRAIAEFAIWGNRDAAALTACLSREISDRVRLLLSSGGIDLTGWLESVSHKLVSPNQVETTFTIRQVV